MLRDDYVMRMVRQLAAAIARIAGLRNIGRDEEALAEIERVWGELFGLPPGLLDSMSPEALEAFLGAPEKTRLVAELLRHEADLLERRGDSARAARKRSLGDALAR